LLDAQSNKNIFKTPAEKEKMIRIGKINKNKCEHIKIDSINRSIRLLKEQKKQLQIHSQSKSKSNKKNQDKSTPKFSKFNNLNKV